ncbi:hypothetical protein JVT61DRAFT_4718 [Boletus reticuloceps]|uniref:Uncharacterized protein n=1 Tax=Boletus reticuloceps TaxID=495285 RepID=A0A8I3A8Q6_9AGAM|nr:hypothetical protein JVT61DRAFT_4718 [Boletus reticuloceps]
MSQIPLDLIDTSESSGPGEAGSSSSPNEASGQVNDSSEEPNRNPRKFSWKKLARELQPFVSNFLALASRFIQLCLKPEGLASIILDFWSLSLSIIWTGKQSGLDLLYPLTSLKKQKSGRLARLLLEHSRDLQQSNLHDASSRRDGVDPPLVAVIDLNEVSPEVIEKNYTIPADFYGFVVMVVFLEILISPILYIFSPIDLGPYIKWLGEWVTYLFGDWIGAWFAFFASLVLSGAVVQGVYAITDVFMLSFYAVLRGEGTLTLVRRSDVSAPGSAALLDRDFTVILTGTQSVVEAIAESSFSMSHTLARKYQVEAWQLGQYLFYEALKALCQGVPFAILAGFWLLLNPTSLLMAIVPLVLIAVVSLARIGTDVVRALIRRRRQEDVDFHEFSKMVIIATFRSLVSAAPTFLLILLYGLAIVKHPLLRGLLQPTIWLRLVPYIFMTIHLISSPNYRIRTTTLLDILGSPPVRRWEFDTLAAAATFQCLVLCRGLPRPIESIDVLTLLDTFVPDERDVWKVWKARVADRITHEVDISFAPTLPSFGDERQKHLKDLLDEAQTGYSAYASFYDWHVPLHNSAIAL